MSEIMEMVKEMAEDFHKADVMDEITMKSITALCLPDKRSFQPTDIKRIRMNNNVSQPVFAEILGIGKTTVQQWEHGKKKPNGAANRLLDLIDRKGISILA
uniref:Transcriptional regulator, XRE family n=1 Tax=Chlorobium chlorochromatii (strain CaD3) TaxID=340177 RepID=Q3AQ53_CHLCH